MNTPSFVGLVRIHHSLFLPYIIFLAVEKAIAEGFQKARDLIRATIISAIRACRAISVRVFSLCLLLSLLLSSRLAMLVAAFMWFNLFSPGCSYRNRFNLPTLLSCSLNTWWHCRSCVWVSSNRLRFERAPMFAATSVPEPWQVTNPRRGHTITFVSLLLLVFSLIVSLVFLSFFLLASLFLGLFLSNSSHAVGYDRDT